MSYSITEVVIGGSRQKVLMQAHMPVYYPNLYITREMRKRSPNTQQAFLNHVGVLLGFFKAERIDIESRLNKRPASNYLDDAELSRFVQHANWKKSVLDKKYEGVSLLPSAHEEVGGTQAEARCEAAREYLVFLYEQLGDRRGCEAAVEWLKSCMKRKIKAVRPAWRKSSLDDIKELTCAQRDLLYEKLAPDHPDNPFKRNPHRYRNYIIILLGLELGLRRSEMLLVKLSDIDYARQSIDIVRPPENVDRRNPIPRLKTNERILPVSDLLMLAIERYRREYRISDNARKHPFLLVAHGRNEGEALSLKSMDVVFDTLEENFSELVGVTAHTLRHDSVYTLLASIDAELKKIPVEDRIQRVQKTLTYAFGWSLMSEMPGRYGAKFWREQASEFFDKRAEHFANRAERIKDLREGTK
ncbi:MAG: integrase [Cellvibrionaceae bacterium]|nr:integrase [Cellvibrionaceae bacterium]